MAGMKPAAILVLFIITICDILFFTSANLLFFTLLALNYIFSHSNTIDYFSIEA